MDQALAPHAPPSVSTRALFFRFLQVGLSGFGGVLPLARRMLVDQRHWLTELEFAEMLSLGQFLPGPNIVNVAIMVGRRYQGAEGALAACLGLMLMPMVVVMSLAALYAQFSTNIVVQNALNGVAAAGSGLVLSTGLKMSRTIRNSALTVCIGLVSFVAIALARVPLLWVLGTLAPVSIAIFWFRRR